MPDDITPIRQQYLDIKKQYPDAILFFRLGDFYETFDNDAQVTSRELDIVLTSRSVAKGQRIPMAGVPHHAVEGYIAKLIAKGYKVAICEQMSDKPVNGLMPREVVRVVTPGTVVEPDADIAATYPDPEAVIKAYRQNAEALRQVESLVLEDQAVDLLLEHAKVTDQPATFKDVMNFGA